MTLFEKGDAYASFERVPEETCERTEMHLLSYCMRTTTGKLFQPALSDLVFNER